MDYITYIRKLSAVLKISGGWLKLTGLIAIVSQALDLNAYSFKMDYIIYIQTSRDEKRDLIPTEIAVVTLQKPSILHWIVSPPCTFSHLSRDIQNTLSYFTTNIYGLQYPEGSVSVAFVETYVREISAAAATIYVKGRDVAHYVEKVIGRNVKDLSDYNCSSWVTLGGKFEDILVCNQHERRKSFFHYSKEKPMISSNLFLSLLQAKARRDVEFRGEHVGRRQVNMNTADIKEALQTLPARSKGCYAADRIPCRVELPAALVVNTDPAFF